MAGEWRATTFQQLLDEGILEIGDGYRAQNKELGGTGPIFLRAGHVTASHIDFAGVEYFHADLEDKVRSKMSKVGDTIITTKGNSTGRTSFVTDRLPPFVYSPHLSYWRSRDPEQLSGGFLRYWSQGQEFVEQLSAMKASTDMAPYLSLTDQRRLSITLPPPTHQKAIASVLGALDDKIELNRRMNATLEAMARALFQSWFVDFDPVRAKIDGRQPTGMDKVTAALFPDSFQDSPIGSIPKSWRAARVGEISSRIAMGPFGSRITRDNFVPEGIPIVRGGNLTNGFVDDDFVFLTESKADELKASVARPQDIVFTHRGTLGQVGIIPISARFPRYVVSQSQMLLSVDREKLSPWAAYLFLSSPQGKAALLASTSTTGVPAISRPTTSLKTIPLVVPPLAVSKRFDELTQPIFLEQEQIAHQSRTLATLRDTLLPKLLSGELRFGSEHEAN